MTQEAQFNAAWDPWIPLMTRSGPELVSMRDAIARGGELTDLAADRPLATLPLVRLLVALVLRVYPEVGTDSEWKRSWREGQFDPEPLDDYLNRNRDRFELYHDEHPFLQVAGLTPLSGPPKPATALLQQVASGNNVTLFSAFTEGDQIVLTHADALLQLLIVQGYDTAAIKTGARGDPMAKGGKTSGNPTGPLGQLGGVVPIGVNLHHTLLLNTPRWAVARDDLPAWERTLTPAWETRTPTGLLDLLTWSSRRMRLVPHQSGVGSVVISAGDRQPFVDPNLEPHTRWRDNKTEGAAFRPIRWPAGSNAWRGLDTLLALNELGESRTAMVLRQAIRASEVAAGDYPIRVVCLGVAYGNMSAVIEDVFIDRLPLPLAALAADEPDVRDALLEVCARAEKVRQALNRLADKLRSLEGAEKLPWDSGVHPGNDAMPQLTAPTERLLSGISREPERYEEGLAAWTDVARSIAWACANQLLDGAPPGAFQGRQIKKGSSARQVHLADVERELGKDIAEALPKSPPADERTTS